MLCWRSDFKSGWDSSSAIEMKSSTVYGQDVHTSWLFLSFICLMNPSKFQTAFYIPYKYIQIFSKEQKQFVAWALSNLNWTTSFEFLSLSDSLLSLQPEIGILHLVRHQGLASIQNLKNCLAWGSKEWFTMIRHNLDKIGFRQLVTANYMMWLWQHILCTGKWWPLQLIS